MSLRSSDKKPPTFQIGTGIQPTKEYRPWNHQLNNLVRFGGEIAFANSE